MARVNCDLADYQQVFALDNAQSLRVIEFNSGCNSAKAEQPNAYWVSCDSLYIEPPEVLHDWSKMQSELLSQTYMAHPDRFSWHRFNNFSELLSHNDQVAARFVQDYEKNPQHYVAHTLENHPYPKNSFDIVLLHYFFSRPGLTLEGLFIEIQQALFLAPQVQIFPLLDESELASPWLAPLLLLLQQNDIGVELRQTNYEWQVKGSVLLLLQSQACQF